MQMFQLTSLRLVVGLMPGRSFFHAYSTGGRIVNSEHEFQARPDVWRNLVRAGLALLPAALVGWVGSWVLAVSAVVLVSLLLGRRMRIPHSQWDVAATATTL